MTLTNHEINILQHGVINCVTFGATGATTFEKNCYKTLCSCSNLVDLR